MKKYYVIIIYNIVKNVKRVAKSFLYIDWQWRYKNVKSR